LPIIALFVATTEVDGQEREVQLSVVAENRERELLVYVNEGLVDRSTGLPTDRDPQIIIRVTDDPWNIALISNIVADPLTVCLLTCAASTIIDIIKNCMRSARSRSDLIRCLRQHGVSLISDAVKCAITCGFGGIIGGGGAT
jgi:hypothetical protein